MSMFCSIDINYIAFLVAVCVIVGLFLCNKNTITKEKLHLFYISGILVILLVCIVSFFCVNNDREGILYNYLSFASTLSSIILSVLAIIITVLSNNSMDNLKNAIDTVKELPNEIKESIEKPLDAINTSTEKLKEIVTETKNAQTTNNEATQEILKKIEDHLSSHDKTLEQVSLQLKSQDNDNLYILKEGSKLKDLDQNQVKAFVDSLPQAFLYLIKTVDIVTDQYIGKYISLKEIGRIVGDSSLSGIELYFYSACISLQALNLIEFDRSSMNVVKFIALSPVLKNVYEEKYSEIEDGSDFIKQLKSYLDGSVNNEEAGEER